MIKRGEIYLIQNESSTGHEQRYTRPAIVVSNNACNKHSSVIEVVYLTTREKRPLPTHVEINSTGIPSIALCEAIYSIDLKRLKNYISTCTDAEIKNINNALKISIGLNGG